MEVQSLLGPLSQVSNITRISSTISWNRPSSLKLTNIEPDIIYCVEVYNITCGRGSLVVSNCSVTESRLVDESLQSGHIYNITITPRSNVENASNGTSLTKEGRLPWQNLIHIILYSWIFVSQSTATKISKIVADVMPYDSILGKHHGRTHIILAIPCQLLFSSGLAVTQSCSWSVALACFNSLPYGIQTRIITDTLNVEHRVCMFREVWPMPSP